MQDATLLAMAGLVAAAGLGAAWLLWQHKFRLDRKILAGELEKLHGQLREQAEKRAAAEEKNSRLPALEEALAQARAENSGLRARLSEQEATLLAERKHAAEKITLLKEAKDQLTLEFQNIAAKIFEEKSRKFTDQNKANLDVLLGPVRTQLIDFKKKIEDVYDKESKDRMSLFTEIVHLKTLNQRISEEAVNLTNALKGQSKVRGAWGEVILERLLEESGLRPGHEYETQASFATGQGRMQRPDVVVHLPEGKDVIVDSKVSLLAYERYCAARTDCQRREELDRHLLALRTHIRALQGKKYEDLPGLRSLDFVLLFIPVEGAFMLAMESQTGLFDEALAANILLVCPSTLLATLRTIQNIWRYEYQNQNALTIAKKAGDLYDKFVGFVEALEDVGHKIGKAQEAYEAARNRLTDGKGNLIRRVRELETLGVKSKKALPAALVSQAEEADG